jgi:antitoxin CptB
VLDPVELRRLQWHCRRGMLENDLVLQEFMGRHGSHLEGERLKAFKDLLEYSDGDLWDLIGGRREVPDAALKEVVDLLRDCRVKAE